MMAFCVLIQNMYLSIVLQEKRREEEEAQARANMQLAQLAAHAKIAKDLSNEVLGKKSSLYADEAINLLCLLLFMEF